MHNSPSRTMDTVHSCSFFLLSFFLFGYSSNTVQGGRSSGLRRQENGVAISGTIGSAGPKRSYERIHETRRWSVEEYQLFELHIIVADDGRCSLAWNAPPKALNPLISFLWSGWKTFKEAQRPVSSHAEYTYTHLCTLSTNKRSELRERKSKIQSVPLWTHSKQWNCKYNHLTCEIFVYIQFIFNLKDAFFKIFFIG